MPMSAIVRGGVVAALSLGLAACGGGGSGKGSGPSGPAAAVFDGAVLAPGGEFVAFHSDYPDLVEDDGNDDTDAFVQDLLTGEIRRASVSSDGVEANGWSGRARSSSDGRWVAYESDADNLVEGDANEMYDVFVHDFQTGDTFRVSVDSDGNEANDGAGEPSITADGRFVAFQSYSASLLGEDVETYWRGHVFVRDLETGETVLASVDSDGNALEGDSEGPEISPDGRWLLFTSAYGLDESGWPAGYGLFLRDLQEGATTRIWDYALEAGAETWSGRVYSFSPDGAWVLFSAYGDPDAEYTTACFSYALDGGVLTLESKNADGVPGWGTADGLAITPDGAWAVFTSDSDNLVEGDLNEQPDVFRRNRTTGEVEIVSVATDGAQPEFGAWAPSISDDGSRVAFQSWSPDLVVGDTNEAADVFVHDFDAGTTIRVSVDSDGNQADFDSWVATISPNGRWVLFASEATTLLGDDPPESYDDVFIHEQWYVHDLLTGATYLASETP
jgi:Tol biopolymer transport system component